MQNTYVTGSRMASPDAPDRRVERAEGEASERLIDVGSHLRTWAGFRHLAFWAAVHAFIALIGIYFFLVGDGVAGFIFIVVSVATLFYGIATIGKARREETRNPPL